MWKAILHWMFCVILLDKMAATSVCLLSVDTRISFSTKKVSLLLFYTNSMQPHSHNDASLTPTDSSNISSFLAGWNNNNQDIIFLDETESIKRETFFAILSLGLWRIHGNKLTVLIVSPCKHWNCNMLFNTPAYFNIAFLFQLVNTF